MLIRIGRDGGRALYLIASQTTSLAVYAISQRIVIRGSQSYISHKWDIHISGEQDRILKFHGNGTAEIGRFDFIINLDLLRRVRDLPDTIYANKSLIRSSKCILKVYGNYGQILLISYISLVTISLRGNCCGRRYNLRIQRILSLYSST
jgi:hypothetical protein